MALIGCFGFQFNFCMAFSCVSPISHVHGVEESHPWGEHFLSAEGIEEPQKLVVSFISFRFYTCFQAHPADVGW